MKVFTGNEFELIEVIERGRATEAMAELKMLSHQLPSDLVP
jgi:hypothetical protein